MCLLSCLPVNVAFGSHNYSGPSEYTVVFVSVIPVSAIMFSITHLSFATLPQLRVMAPFVCGVMVLPHTIIHLDECRYYIGLSGGTSVVVQLLVLLKQM